MTLTTLHGKFSDANSGIQWSQYDRQKLNDAETIFTTITVFIGVVAVYVYNRPEDIRKFVYNIFDGVLNSQVGDWIRITFPIVSIVLGSILYGRLNLSPIEVRKTPKHAFCSPLNDPEIQDFKLAFIKSYWCVMAFLLVLFARPFIEANFNVFGLSPSAPFGFSPEDRTLIFGQNPTISLISLLTFGVSNLMKINDSLRTGSFTKYYYLLFFVLIWTMIIYSFGMSLGIKSGEMLFVVILLLLFAFMSVVVSKYMFKNTLSNILLLDVLRWDLIYMMLKYGLGLAGLVYAGYSIKYFSDIPEGNPCLFEKAFIRQLYIGFIFFLIMLYAFNTLSASVLTFITTNITRYLVPPTLLGLSSYLVFITNYFVTMAPKLIVQ
jgi:hypothetical protein